MILLLKIKVETFLKNNNIKLTLASCFQKTKAK